MRKTKMMPVATQDGATLMRAAQTDPASFGSLFDRHFTAVYRFCERRVGRTKCRKSVTYCLGGARKAFEREPLANDIIVGGVYPNRTIESSRPVHRLRTGETQRLESENKRMPRNV